MSSTIQSSIIFIALSAAFVGLVHSLAPGHWLPVILVMKSRKWPVRTAMTGALIAAGGHIIVSIALGLASIWAGDHIFKEMESAERVGELVVAAFGFIYAGFAYFRHSSCHGHTHHGPEVPSSGNLGAFLFLFSLGFSPCIAVLPLFIAAASRGSAATLVTMASFSAGVVIALVGATWAVSFKVLKLDHPILEHYGDVITGLAVGLMGITLYLFF